MIKSAIFGLKSFLIINTIVSYPGRRRERGAEIFGVA